MNLLAIREEWLPQGNLGYLIEEVATGKFFDFAAGGLADHPQQMIGELKERWKEHGHAAAEPKSGDDVRPLRGCYANVSADQPERAALDVEQLPSGMYKIYICDMEANGNVVRVYDWLHASGPAGSGTGVNFQIPENLALRGSLTLDIPGLGPLRLGPGLKEEQAPAVETPVPARPAPAPPQPPVRKPTSPTPPRRGGRKST